MQDHSRSTFPGLFLTVFRRSSGSTPQVWYPNSEASALPWMNSTTITGVFVSAAGEQV